MEAARPEIVIFGNFAATSDTCILPGDALRAMKALIKAGEFYRFWEPMIRLHEKLQAEEAAKLAAEAMVRSLVATAAGASAH